MYFNLYFHFFALVSRQSARLSSVTQHAMPPEFCGKWETKCHKARLPMPTLPHMGHCVRLCMCVSLTCYICVGKSLEGTFIKFAFGSKIINVAIYPDNFLYAGIYYHLNSEASRGAGPQVSDTVLGIKYLIFSFPRSGNEAECGAELCH